MFDFNYQTDSEVGASNRDVITDFVSGSDKIDVVDLGNFTIVSTDNTAGNGLTDFTNTGQEEIAWMQSGTDTIILFDFDGNGATDMEIELTGLMTLEAADFVT